MRKLVSVVFTIHRNLHYGRQCIEHLRQNGFTNAVLKVFPAAPKKSSNHVLHKSIMANHYNVTQWFVKTYDTKTHDLMVCEDDCEFTETNVAKLVHDHLDILHANYEWSLYLLGQFSYGPMFVTDHDRLSRTIFPALAHCYILNGTKLKAYLNSIDRRRWTTPFMVEGWFLLPSLEKFAIFPSIATQNRPIKDLRNTYLGTVPLIKLVHGSNNVMHCLPFVVVLILLIVLLCKCWRKYK